METKTIWIDGEPYVKASELPEEGIPAGYGVILDDGDRFGDFLRKTEEERPFEEPTSPGA